MQDSQTPSQALSQQTPSTQKPESQSLGPLGHAPPIISRPQLPFTHWRPLTQSVSLAQLERQLLAPGLHENGAQTNVAPALQFPAPSHTSVPTISEAVHVPAPQVVPAG